MDYLYVAGGLALLFFGGESLVKGAVSLSMRLGLSAFLISIAVIGFGTSLPEMLVSIQAALSGAPGIALGNVVGSNIANILLIAGTAAILCPVTGKTDIPFRDQAVMTGVSALLVAILYSGEVSALAGLIMLVILAGYLLLSLKLDQAGTSADDEALATTTPGKTAALLMAGFVMLMVGANLLVTGATAIATSWGVSNAVIGLTVVAVGTSLPELATSIAAAVKRKPEIAIGNIVGSNIFNILAILGVTSLIAEVPVAERFVDVDGWVMLASAVLLAVLIMTRLGLNRITGLAMVATYAAYIWSMA